MRFSYLHTEARDLISETRNKRYEKQRTVISSAFINITVPLQVDIGGRAV
jgi:hypothetical protein